MNFTKMIAMIIEDAIIDAITITIACLFSGFDGLLVPTVLLSKIGIIIAVAVVVGAIDNTYLLILIYRGGGTGEAGEATASPEFRGFTTEKFLASWIYMKGEIFLA